MLIDDDTDDDVLKAPGPAGDPDAVAFTDDPVRFRVIAVDVDLPALTRAFRFRARFEQTGDIQPEVEANTVVHPSMFSVLRSCSSSVQTRQAMGCRSMLTAARLHSVLEVVDLSEFHPDPDAVTNVPSDGFTPTIGSYRLLERIGEGGMGDVWLAEQTQPIRRRVALKVIKAGMDRQRAVRARSAPGTTTHFVHDMTWRAQFSTNRSAFQKQSSSIETCTKGNASCSDQITSRLSRQ